MINQDILNDLDDLQDDHISQEEEEDLSEHGQGVAAIHGSQLLANQDFNRHMETISSLVDNRIEGGEGKGKPQDANLIQKCNQYASSITKQISATFRAVKSIYYKRFPQLESIITQPALYCKAVQQIQKAERGQGEAKFAFLTKHQKMTLQISLSTIHDKLPAQSAENVIQLAGTAAILHEHHNLLMMYLESCMQVVAPNLCELLGSLTASKIISAAGGVKELAAIPACNIQVLGGQRSAQIGFAQMQRNHTGIFAQMDMVKDAPKDYQMQLVRMLASNTAKCARADMLKSSKGLGARLREELLERFDKIQEEGGLHRIDRPLEVPDLQPKKKRGGKRHRKNKQLYEMSDIRKQQNRLKFGQEAQEELDDGVGLGMLTQGSGKLKLQIKKQKVNTSKKMTQRMNKQTGLESVVNINAPQGMELVNPDQSSRQQSGNQTIFSKTAGFSTVLNSKFGNYK